MVDDATKGQQGRASSSESRVEVDGGGSRRVSPG